MRWMRFPGFLAGLCAALFLAGCASLPAAWNLPLSSITQTGPAPELRPYATRTPEMTPATLTATTPPDTATPAATATQQTYKVVRNDTLTGIARRFGVTLDGLLAANPGLSANSLQVGQSLKIPAASQGADVAALSTPAPLDIGSGFCQPSGGGMYCYVPVHNPYAEPLENISLQVSLLGADGQALADQTAILLLNILQPDQVLPAGVFFKDATGGVSARGLALSAIRLSPGDPRYLQTSTRNLLVSTAWDGLSATVEGKISLTATGKPATRLWLVAVAYDSNDEIVGARRWEWSGTLQPGDSQPFKLAVYSLGPAIRHVEVQVEARP